MAKPALLGSYVLSDANVSLILPKANQIGAYALGRKSKDDQTFFIYYVGRSDTDLAERLKQHAAKNAHPQFMYQLCISAKDAFETECELWHDFSPSENVIHPDRPAGTNWKCPRCKQFG